MGQDTQPLVLLVDRKSARRNAICSQLGTLYRVIEASGIAEAMGVLEETGQVSLLLAGHELADGTGLEMLDQAMGYWPPIPAIYVIEPGEEKAAVTALRQGAADYVVVGSTTDLRLAQVLGNAMARSQAELAAQQYAREMGVLNVVLTALNRAMDEQPVLDTIVHEVHALMGTDACSIILVDEDSDQMFLRASTRLPISDGAWPVPASKSIAGRVVREKRGCLTADVTQDPDWHSLGVDDIIPTPVRSMVTVPLITGDQAIGVLQAINKRVGPFLPSDLALMESIAAVATAAIVRGHQFSQGQAALQATAQQAALGQRVGRAILDQVGSMEVALGTSPLRSHLAAIRAQVDDLLQATADQTTTVS